MILTLRDLVDAARESAASRRARIPLASVRAEAELIAADGRGSGRFRNALEGPGVALIAEVKGASPLRGPLREDFEPVDLARGFEEHGAAAISVLTEGHFFAGALGHLRAVSQVVDLPVMRKDFITGLYQVYEAAAAGASAILLIVEILSRSQVHELAEAARSVGLDTLVEVHRPDSIDTAMNAGSGLIGVNNRDLETMQVDIEHSLQLAAYLPDGILRVSESGIESVTDIQMLRAAGYDAALVGTAIVTAADPNSVLQELAKG
jgi:indole-3-glycerol phosphate synthase